MRFSVIIPLYNKAPYVKKAIESVLEQTWRDFELVVVDDGSSDDSYAIAESVLKECTIPYQLIHQKNTGVSTARNNGVATSHGDFLCFLDADDWWMPTFLEKMDGLIRDYPEAGIYGTNYYYVKNGIEKVCILGVETGYINYCRIYAERLKMPLWTGATSLSKKIFHEMGGFRPHLRLGEDFDLWIKIALKYKVAFLNEPLSYYFQDSDATWRLIGKLQEPSYHMLWNLDYLAEEEKSNPDYKQLIDNLRTYSLLPYYLSSEFRNKAKTELAKVCWEKQPQKVVRLYKTPTPILIIRSHLLRLGSSIKQLLKRIIHTK
jgi:glycosyltransferase involved in cell wall biosynthesis